MSPKEDILRAAQREFGDHGYDQGSVRAVARRAKVNPALVYHYFGDKGGLFRATLRRMMRAPPVIESTLRNVGPEIGPIVVRAFLERWSEGPDAMPFRGLLRSASTSKTAARILRELVAQQVAPLVRSLGSGSDTERRVALVASTLLGAGFIRFVVRLPGLADATVDDIARWIGPAISGYLLDGPGR